MTTEAATHTTEETRVVDRRIQYLKGGSGAPLLVLHHSTGNPGWLPFYSLLARNFTVYVPDLPGYGQSERPEWAREPRDLGIILNFMLRRLNIERPAAVGLGFGGWIAAEMATMDADVFSSMTLVGPVGIQPTDGEIVDQMLIDYHEYVQAGFHDPARYTAEFGAEPSTELKELWDFSREMTARLSWKPYMFNRRLPHLLRETTIPTLIVWGEDDRIVPRSTGDQFRAVIPNAKFELLKDCGHIADVEQPDRLAELVRRHAAGS
jgi:pimeloyl-ACP methyl ester carboxylesterase